MEGPTTQEIQMDLERSILSDRDSDSEGDDGVVSPPAYLRPDDEPPKDSDHQLISCQSYETKNFDEYWKILLIVGMLYGIPSVQVVLLQYTNTDDPRSVCYYNNKCLHPFLGIEAFNNVVSNISYIVGGLIFLWYVVWTARPRDTRQGLHPEIGLYIGLGITMILEGIFSGLYHVCPTDLNFQFDMTYITMGGCLFLVCLYHKRHPENTSDATTAYSFFTILISLNVFDLVFRNEDSIILAMWIVVAMATVVSTAYFTAHIYYHGKFTPDAGVFTRVTGRFYRHIKNRRRIRNMPHFIGLVLMNIVNFGMSLYGLISQPRFFTWVMGLMLLNNMIYVSLYLAMKKRYKEKVAMTSWVLLALSVPLFVFAAYFFYASPTNKFLPKDESDKLNRPCIVFGYFDEHDVWHFLSACAILCIFSLVYIVDRPQDRSKRSRMFVF